MAEKFRKLKLIELNRLDPEEFKEIPKIPIIVVLDNIRSFHNVGSIFRSADAFRIQSIYLTGYTAQPPHREIHKTALGATETVEWTYFKNAAEAIHNLEEKGFEIIPIEQAENATSLDKITMMRGRKIALIFGNEVDGVSEEYMEAAKTVVEVPQQGTKHSLNVSVCAGIVLWEFFKMNI